MKKQLAILCVLAMLLSLGMTSAFASGEPAEEEYDAAAARVEAFMGGGGPGSGEASGGSNEPVVYEPGTVTRNGDGSVTVTGGVTETVEADTLILQGAGPVEGKLLTLVSEGIEVPVADGTYKDAVLVVTDYIHREDGLYTGAMTKSAGTAWRTAVMIDGGAFDAAASATAALQAGEIGEDAASGIVIDSDAPLFDGVMVNDSEYTINGMFMTADGSGGTDFTGYGAGVASFGASKTTINGLVFLGKGAQRHGVFMGGTSPELGLEVTVNGSYVRADGSKYESHATGMSGCPWMLGISAEGHARATMADGFGIAHYNDCILLTDGWGILSTDDVAANPVWGDYTLQLEVRNSVVDVTLDSTDTPSAYATYAIGACMNRFYGCAIGNAADSDLFKKNAAALPDYGVDYDYDTVEYGLTYGAVVANEYAGVGFYDGTVVDTKYGVMYHKTSNVRFPDGTGSVAEAGVTEVKDSTVKTYGAAFLIKACTPVIEVENSLFIPEKGVIVQLMTCDDPGMGAPNFSETLFTDPDAFAAGVAADPDYDPYDYNLITRTLNNNSVENFIVDPQVTFTDCNEANGTALNGDFYNSISVSTSGEGMTWFGQNLILNFVNCDVNGNASSTSALHVEYGYFTDDAGNVIEADDAAAAIAAGAVTGVIDSSTATLLGNLDNTPTATVNNGVWVSLTEGSVWTPADTCYITRLFVDDTSAVNGTVTVDGVPTAVEPGVVYTGAIVVEPAAAAASGETSPEPSAEPAAAPTAEPADGGYTADEAGYQTYLKAYVDACPAVTDEQYQEFAALIDAGDYASFPVDMCFTDTYWGYTALTLDEFLAAGGAAEIPAFDPGLTAD